ncbi:MAG: hypothetical protein ABWY93_21920, partial [Mycobacterium sp.]
MERLPYIDEHAITVPANRDATWRGLLTVMCRDPRDPATVPPGFVLDEAIPGERLVLKGRHPFSIYQLIFELAGPSADTTEVRAITLAAFPGLHGTLYRALVIGSGGHTVVVRRMLRRIASAAR